VVDAVRCAIEIQLGMAERNAGLPSEKRIEHRIGVHIEDVVEESDGDLVGDGVNIAARLEGIAKPGAICLSEQAYWQVKGRLDLGVKDLGPTQLKNIAQPVHVYSLEAGVPAKAKPLKRAARGQRSMIIALAALVVALAAIGAGVWHFRSAGAKPERVAVMVLPFTNLSGDSSVNPLAEAVTDGLTDAASRFRVQVIASDTAKACAGKPVDVKQNGKELGLRYLVRGRQAEPITARALVEFPVRQHGFRAPAVIKTGPVILNHDVDLAAIVPRPHVGRFRVYCGRRRSDTKVLWKPIHYVSGLGDMASLWQYRTCVRLSSRLAASRLRLWRSVFRSLRPRSWRAARFVTAAAAGFMAAVAGIGAAAGVAAAVAGTAATAAGTADTAATAATAADTEMATVTGLLPSA
jgi:Adenylate and Guanylate cyclase catalytic domain